MRNTYTTKNHQQDLETATQNRSVSSYAWNIARHAIPIIGALWISNNLSCTYPTSAKNITTVPALEQTVSLPEEKIEEKRPAIHLPTLQELVQIDPIIEGKYAAVSKYATQINLAEKKYGIPTGLYAGVIIHESGGNPRAVSPVGAAGLSQLMPAIAEELGAKVWYESDKPPAKSTGYGDSLLALVKNKKNTRELGKIDERFIPEKSIDKGARYLRQLFNQFGDWDLALKAFNVGPYHKKFHRIKPGYSKTVRKYQEYWNGRNRELQNFAYSLKEITRDM